MKRTFYVVVFSLLCIGLSTGKSSAQVAKPMPTSMPGASNPWSDSQLLEPADLAAMIKSADKKPVVLNIGAVEDIPRAIHIGAVSNPDNMKKLQKAVNAFPKNGELVIYCGCCPFAKCPNIGPAFRELKRLGFTILKSRFAC